MKVSLIIVTYNAPQYLALVLESVCRQKVLPYEVVVADDGSTDDTRQLVESLQNDFPCGLKYVWHEDKGFRSAKIRNMAIKVTEGDYLIFSDGDLMFHPKFVSDFLVMSDEKELLIGTRLFLSRDFTMELLKEGACYKPFIPICSKVEKNQLNGIRIPYIYRLFKVYYEPSMKLRGGLLIVSKREIELIGGWDESYEGWGSEDTDLVMRLIHNGCRARKLKHQGLTYHLWHNENSRASKVGNESLLKECRDERRVKAIKGL